MPGSPSTAATRQLRLLERASNASRSAPELARAADERRIAATRERARGPRRARATGTVFRPGRAALHPTASPSLPTAAGPAQDLARRRALRGRFGG